ncbi:MAG: capsular biosynthesis protein [Geobacteraceae bacterium GWC2_55_20]|nr:MAG: capsular biosynthesis protein [Geobacteraceae bacterium GWC2_55_20]OGU26283.1 MAG: capsular biosynthesis protein [Geobacteraceae bacterium GWF2_54_21]HBA73706.1 capsular biosynthesis protein [Geobacter sp.]HCE68548.1 capsular biosynthesis protein [Geobacter sp.]
MKPALTLILLTLALLCAPIGLRAEEIIINAVGDIMLAGKWAKTLKSRGYEHPFAEIRSELARGDINLANLESPVATGGSEFSNKQFRFRAEPAVAKAVRAAGFNLVTLANNHSMDFGGDALAETLQHLDSAGIAWVGAGMNLDEARKMALYTIKGKKIAFLGYSLTQPLEFFAGKTRPGTTPGYEKLVTADVASARRQADYVIVSFHWGREASGTVQTYQRNAAHNAIDAGADAVIGHHPHVLQGIERYKNGIIFYSLGNFAFASKGKTADVSALIRLRLDGRQRMAEILPLDVLHRRVGFQPRLLSGNRAEEVIEKLRVLSRPFKTDIRIVDDRYSINF